MELVLQRLELFFLMLVRLMAFFLVAPVFAARGVPVLVRMGLAAVSAFLLLPSAAAQELAFSSSTSYALLAAREALVGLALGYVVALFLSTVQMGGELLDVHMGLGMANLLDPQYGVPITLWGQFWNVLGIILFLQLDGHHVMLWALGESFRVVPVGAGAANGALTQELLRIWSEVMRRSLGLALPVIGTLFVADVALGLLSRTVPQLNMFILSFPVKLGLGLLVATLVLPLFMVTVVNLVGQMERDLGVVLGRLLAWQGL